MTKRRHPTPVGQRRHGAGQGRLLRPRPEASPDYFDERLRLFRHASERASELSKKVAGRFVDERKGWAQWNHLRMCIASSSMITLADFQPRIDAGEECTLDHGSIAALARSMAESGAMVAYLTDPSLTPEQWDLRKQVLWLHDATTRYKMFSKLEKPEEAAGFRAHMQDIRARIEAFPEFQALAPERQGRLIAGSEIYLHGLRSAVRLAGRDVDEFDAMYGYLSSYTHSSPVSFMRLGDHGVDFKVPTRAQRGVAGNALEFAFNSLQTATVQVAAAFGVEAAAGPDVPGARGDLAGSQGKE